MDFLKKIPTFTVFLVTLFIFPSLGNGMTSEEPSHYDTYSLFLSYELDEENAKLVKQKYSKTLSQNGMKFTPMALHLSLFTGDAYKVECAENEDKCSLVDGPTGKLEKKVEEQKKELEEKKLKLSPKTELVELCINFSKNENRKLEEMKQLANKLNIKIVHSKENSLDVSEVKDIEKQCENNKRVYFQSNEYKEFQNLVTSLNSNQKKIRKLNDQKKPLRDELNNLLRKVYVKSLKDNLKDNFHVSLSEVNLGVFSSGHIVNLLSKEDNKTLNKIFKEFTKKLGITIFDEKELPKEVKKHECVCFSVEIKKQLEENCFIIAAPSYFTTQGTDNEFHVTLGNIIDGERSKIPPELQRYNLGALNELFTKYREQVLAYAIYANYQTLGEKIEKEYSKVIESTPSLENCIKKSECKMVESNYQKVLSQFPKLQLPEKEDDLLKMLDPSEIVIGPITVNNIK